MLILKVCDDFMVIRKVCNDGMLMLKFCNDSMFILKVCDDGMLLHLLAFEHFPSSCFFCLQKWELAQSISLEDGGESSLTTLTLCYNE
jgi:hypothetical protein